jgi:flagellin
MEKLSAGERITKAADDAAGLAISEKLKAEIRSNRQATRNAQDSISLIQVAEGASSEIGNMLIRMRELSIQAASDTISDVERGFVDREVSALKTEVQRIADTTKYNGVHLLKGEGELLEFQVGTGPDPMADRVGYMPEKANATLDGLGIADVSTLTKESSQENLNLLDHALQGMSSIRADFGALQNRLQSTINNLMVTDENLSAANSRIRDADFALESADLTKRNILTQAGTATLAQANSNSALALKLL